MESMDESEDEELDDEDEEVEERRRGSFPLLMFAWSLFDVGMGPIDVDSSVFADGSMLRWI